MQGTTVRINSKSRSILKELVGKQNDTQTQLIQKALENYQRAIFLMDYRRGYELLKSDKEAWAEEMAEREAWDSTISDGLEKGE